MDSAFLILLISGRSEQVKAVRYELVVEPVSKRLMYKFYTEKDQSARCFFASEDIIAIIPSDMRTPAAVN